MADWVLKQGDRAPAYEDTLSFDDGTYPDLTGATLEFVMRSMLATAPIALGGTASIVSVAARAVKFIPASTDTAQPGNYLASWLVTLADGSTMTFPTVGYITVEIQRSLTATSDAQIVGLPDVKEHLGIPAGERDHDARLGRAIEAVRAAIENITGPIIPTSYTEWHPGGQPNIAVRHRPSTSYGTSPVFTVESVSEFAGMIERDLSAVLAPSLGVTYSYMVNAPGFISRLTGGGPSSFGSPVRVTYTAGQNPIPANVYEAALELVRVNYSTTIAAGRGRLTVADDQDTGIPIGFFVPRKIREMLAPNRRAPAVF